MLSPKYLEALPQPIIKIYSEFENELLEDIAKRITKADYLTSTAEWRLYKAEQLRLSSREITQRLARLTGRSEKEIRQLYTGALKEALRNDEKIYRAAIKAGCLSEDAEHKLDSYFGSIAFSNALKAGYRNTNGLMRNLCNSAAAQANSRLSDELDKAFLKVTSGAYTADEAVYSAVQDLGKSGIKVINYSTGHKDKVDGGGARTGCLARKPGGRGAVDEGAPERTSNRAKARSTRRNRHNLRVETERNRRCVCALL